jgi:TatD DNase family protein
MKLFDSHCHIDDKAFAKDLDAVLERAGRAGVARMMCAGVTPETSRKAVSLAEKNSGIVAAVGIHPHDVRHSTEADLDHLVALSRTPQVVAWGEIGLDFNRMYSPRKAQERWFIRQLETAADLDLPVIFHERDSGGRFLDILSRHPSRHHRGVVHCFSGTAAELARYIDMGLYIGITGIVTMPDRGRDLRRMIPGIPADRLLIETDAPYLTPVPENRRHRRNEPAFVRSVMLKLAEVRREDPQKLADQLWQNTCRLYGLDAVPRRGGETD